MTDSTQESNHLTLRQQLTLLRRANPEVTAYLESIPNNELNAVVLLMS